MSWYNNDEGFVAQRPRKYTPRFRMKVGTERLITFVDTPVISLDGIDVQTPFLYQEYSIELNGRWGNFFTQPFVESEDVLRQMGYKSSRVAAMTVIDHNEWTDKNGVLHKDEVVLYVMKRSQPIWAQVERLLQREGSLAGKTFLVSRLGDKSSAVGTMLERHEQDYVLDPQIHKPFNYLEILKPKPKEELEALFNKEPQQQPATQQGWGQPQQQPSQGWGQPQPNQGWGQPQQASQWNDSRVIGATSSDDSIPF